MKVNISLFKTKCPMDHECLKRVRRKTRKFETKRKGKTTLWNLKKTLRGCKEISLAKARSSYVTLT